ncbi:NAD(P)-binding protein [Pleomassaria siparia CBS 279.74]|uniref:NAD(P)-binding protein n=1 Tax=Pleomassaria siparia CBS 279.74 TaxID=1314801 RepID=A0A6G1KGX4_9PLEO|nr:NAD(P)-binding protein [Pleomassaria siparia CBS 279.74]
MPMKRVLLTGSYNLTGSHILHQLLSYNVSVRAVVCSREEAQILEQQYPPTTTPLLDFTVVPLKDLSIPGAYDDALNEYPEPFDTVIHTITADPSSEEADCLSRFINLETESLINFLRSVKDVATRVHRVIITTSLTPFARWLVDPQIERDPRRGSVLSISSLQRAAEIDSEYVLATSQASDNIVYDAVWQWMKGSHARFDLVTLTAPSIWGPQIRQLENSADLEGGNRKVWNIIRPGGGEALEQATLPPYGIDFFTDVRDLAFATVQAVLVPQAGNRRFVISAGIMPGSAVISDFLSNRFPELGNRLQHSISSPTRRTAAGDPPQEFVHTHLAATILGVVRYRTVEETLTALTQQMLELHRRKEWKRVIQS